MGEPAQPWQDSAQRSLESAKALFSADLWPTACFEAQQCVELALEAAIVRAGSVPPRVHGHSELAAHLSADVRTELQNLIPDFHDLDSYYSPTQYPDAMVGDLPGRQEAHEAVTIARKVMQVVGRAPT